MKKKSIILYLILLIHSCKKEEFDIVNLNGNRISILGHGGMGIVHVYPLNSFESIACCVYLDSDGSEMDVQMTKDSVLVAFHDLELSDHTYLSGNVYNKHWNEISNATYKDPVYTGYKIINLDVLFSGLQSKSGKLYALDCKNYNPDTSTHYLNTFCNALIKLIDKYNLKDNIVIEFHREDLIRTLKALRSDIKIFIRTDFENGLTMGKKYQLAGIVISVDAITKEQVAIAHDNGLMISAFNANTRNKNIEAIKKNVDIIETDNLHHLIKILK